MAKATGSKKVFDLFVISDGRLDAEPLLETVAVNDRRAVSNGYYKLAMVVYNCRSPTKAQLREVINRFHLRAIPRERKPLRSLRWPPRAKVASDELAPAIADQLPWPGDGDVLRPDMWTH